MLITSVWTVHDIEVHAILIGIHHLGSISFIINGIGAVVTNLRRADLTSFRCHQHHAVCSSHPIYGRSSIFQKRYALNFGGIQVSKQGGIGLVLPVHLDHAIDNI